tara:strand:+ start:8565 stop:9632 length:1068 start_codon:yes stop_codon:yes gene_type:complete
MNNQNKTYLLNKKIISIHSCDRDISKWPNSNEFEVSLPIEYKKVSSIRMIGIQLPKNYHVFSNYNQNTKLAIDISGSQHIITITEGSYTHEQMATELNYRLKSIDPSLNVYYNEINTSFYFVHSNPSTSITIQANQYIDYNNNSYNYFNNTFNWGLPAYLGFEKLSYTSSKSSENYILINSKNNITNITINDNVIKSNPAPIFGDIDIYIEIDKFNSMDEIHPYSTNTTTHIQDSSLACSTLHTLRGSKSVYSNYNKTCNKVTNDYYGKYNSAFAKIPITEYNNHVVILDSFLNNIYYSDPPVDSIKKLKFKFRYHDGRLVDFNNFPISITLEINQLRDDFQQNYNIKIPPNYST